MKYTYMERFSILAVSIIFLLQVSQVFLVSRLFQRNEVLLQVELNSALESVYYKDLNLRLGVTEGKDIPDVRYFGITPPLGSDTTKMIHIDSKCLQSIENYKESVSAMTLAMEESVSTKHPINLRQIDSLAKNVFAKNNLNLKFYSQIVDADSKNVLETTWSGSDQPADILYSKKIPLNKQQTRFLRLAVATPTWKVFSQMRWILAFSLLLCIFCIYNFQSQKKTLARQRKLADLKNDFFAEVSHEFKRPLASLLQAMNSLDNEKIILNVEKRHRILRFTRINIINMASRTEVFLSLAQDDEGLFELHRVEFDLVKVVFDLADRFVETIPGSPEIDVDNELKDPMFFGDKDHIEHLISNLISNAVKYSKESIDIHIKLYKENNNVCISVKDTGIGISPENLEVIFERFSRVGEKTHARGHGIGLNYAKRMAEKHGGSISVKSQLNIGSEFILKLPLIKNI